MKHLLFAVMVLIAAMATSASATVITFSTDQTGANTQIDADNTTIWNFTVGAGQSVTGIIGNFEIKRGPGTTDPIVFTLWSGINGTGTILDAVSVAAATVTQSYTPTLFDLDPLAAALGAGAYSVQLSSVTGTAGNKQYFFKDGNVVITPPVDKPVAVPEPSTLVLAALGVPAGLLAWRRRRVRA